MNLKKLSVLFLSIIVNFSLIAQVDGYLIDTVIQSSIYDEFHPYHAVDNSTTNGLVAKTNSEVDPYWEVLFNEAVDLRNIVIYSNVPLSNFYVFTSRHGYLNSSITDNLASPHVDAIHYNQEIAYGEFVLIDAKVKLLRIHVVGTQNLALDEVDIVVTTADPFFNDEVLTDQSCGDGFDNDYDGKVDCQDEDCSPAVLGITTNDPTCQICDDGKMVVRNFGAYEISIDGGNTWINVSGRSTTFSNLLPGSYNIMLRNPFCTTSYYNNPVFLAMPPGQPSTENCANGGFESGNYQNWTGRNGEILFNGDYTNLINTISSRNAILSTIGNDFYAGNDIKIPILGDYSARINDRHVGAKHDQLEYCFTVDQSNEQFHFLYAAVMWDGGHQPSHQPELIWEIVNLTTGLTIDELHVPADDNSPFWNTSPIHSDILYKGWTCVSRDLSAYIGDQVCFRIAADDCSETQHFGYAYVDGICAPSSVLKPKINLSVEDAICVNSNKSIDASGSKLFHTYKWDICYEDASSNITCISVEQIAPSIPPIEDLKDFFEDNVPGGNFIVDCGGTFTVTLTLINDCYQESEVKTIDFYCNDDYINYPDMYICSAANINYQIQGDVNCGTCTYDWEWEPEPITLPMLDSRTVQFPIMQHAYNWKAINQQYKVKAVNSLGCVYTDEMKFHNDGLGDLLGTIQLERVNWSMCEYSVEAKVTLDDPTHSDNLLVKIYSTIQNSNTQTTTGTLVGNSRTDTEFTFRFPGLNLPQNQNVDFTVRVYPNTQSGSDIIVVGNCSFEASFSLGIIDFFGNINVAMPNIFTPFNDDGINDEVFPSFSTNVFEAHFKVEDRWGGIMWEAHAIADPTQGGLTGEELAWDGTYNGQDVSPGVYTYYLSVRNCSNDPAIFPCSVWTAIPSPSSCSGTCNTEPAWACGSITAD